MSLTIKSLNPTVDSLVEGVTTKLQLSEAQERLADERADGVGRWLREPGTPLSKYNPVIFAQGSKRHGTTVRPKNQIEYDVDLVCLLHVPPGDLITSAELYDLVYARLKANPKYAHMLEKKNRCVRLSYAGDFHLDVLAAKPDYNRGGTCILVPDRQRNCWKPSNPKGFADWFDEQAVGGSALLYRHAGEFITDDMRGQFKATLRRVVQLMKRRRDIVFDGDQYCARSVVLTTLAAEEYDGQTLCTDAVVAALDSIIARFGTLIDPPAVPNPTNSAENFADKWDRASFADFMGFVRRFRKEMEAFPNCLEFIDYTADAYALMHQLDSERLRNRESVDTEPLQVKFLRDQLELVLASFWAFERPAPVIEWQVRRVRRYLNWYWRLAQLEQTKSLTTAIRLLSRQPHVELAGVPQFARGRRVFCKLVVPEKTNTLELALVMENLKLHRVTETSSENLRQLLAAFQNRDGREILRFFQMVFEEVKEKGGALPDH